MAFDAHAEPPIPSALSMLRHSQKIIFGLFVGLLSWIVVRIFGLSFGLLFVCLVFYLHNLKEQSTNKQPFLSKTGKMEATLPLRFVNDEQLIANQEENSEVVVRFVLGLKAHYTLVNVHLHSVLCATGSVFVPFCPFAYLFMIVSPQ